MTSPAHTPDFEARVRSSFARQAAMKTIGASLSRVSPGVVEIELPYAAALTQQHGFLHAGTIMVADGQAFAFATDGASRLIASMTCTIMVVTDREGIAG